MVDLHVEIASQEHVVDIWEIIRTSFEGTHSQYVATGQPGYKIYLSDLLNRKHSDSKFLMVAKIQEQVAAFADVTLNTESTNFLTRIAVSRDFRGRGIAGLMMSQIQQTYKTGSKWELDVLHENIGARRLYGSLGFRSISTTKWVGRLLPQTVATRHTGEVRPTIEDSNYVRYGFSNTDIEGQAVSIAGTAVRCRELDQFLDNNFLTQVQHKFPRVDRAFIILDASDTRVESFTDLFEIARSDRMSGTF